MAPYSNNKGNNAKVITAEDFERVLASEKTTTRITLSSERGGHPNDDEEYHSDASIDRAITSPAAFFDYVSNGPAPVQQPHLSQQAQQHQQHQQQQQQKQQQHTGRFSQLHQPVAPGTGPGGRPPPQASMSFPGVLPPRTHPTRNPSLGSGALPSQVAAQQYPATQRPDFDPQADQRVQVAAPPTPRQPETRGQDTKGLTEFLRTTGPEPNAFASQSQAKPKKKKNSFFGFGKKKKEKDADVARGFPPMDNNTPMPKHAPLDVAYDPFRDGKRAHRPRSSEAPRFPSSERRGNSHASPSAEGHGGDYLAIPSNISNKEVRRSIIIAEDEGRFGAPLFDGSGSMDRRKRPDSGTNSPGSAGSNGQTAGSPRKMTPSPLTGGAGRPPGDPRDPNRYVHGSGDKPGSGPGGIHIPSPSAHDNLTPQWNGPSPDQHRQQKSGVPNRLLPDEAFHVSPFQPVYSDQGLIPVADDARQYSQRSYNQQPPHQQSDPRQPQQQQLAQRQQQQQPSQKSELSDDDSDWEGDEYGYDGDDGDYDDFDDLDDETLNNTEINAVLNYGLKEAMAAAQLRQPQRRQPRAPNLHVVFSAEMEECLGAYEDSDGEIEYGMPIREWVPMRDRDRDLQDDDDDDSEELGSGDAESKAPLVILNRASSLGFVNGGNGHGSDSESDTRSASPAADHYDQSQPITTTDNGGLFRSPVMETFALQTPPDTPPVTPQIVLVPPPSASTSAQTTTMLVGAGERSDSLPRNMDMPAPRVVSMSTAASAATSTATSASATPPVSTGTSTGTSTGPAATLPSGSPPATPPAVATAAGPRRKKVRHVQIQTRTPATAHLSVQTDAVSDSRQTENTALLSEVVRLRSLVHSLTTARDTDFEEHGAAKQKFNLLSEAAVRKIKELCRELEVAKVENECLKGV
ncbi:hypothetical protein HKX48_006059, partial [Thoreauomyces humboldtii]